jgi:hypothetical protein
LRPSAISRAVLASAHCSEGSARLEDRFTIEPPRGVATRDHAFTFRFTRERVDGTFVTIPHLGTESGRESGTLVGERLEGRPP